MINRVTNPVHSGQPAETGRDARIHERTRNAPENRLMADRVELSDVARNEAAEEETSPVRSELVERVRSEIAAGTYLTDDKLDAAIERLSGVLGVGR